MALVKGVGWILCQSAPIGRSPPLLPTLHNQPPKKQTTQVKTVGEEKAAMEADPLFLEYMKKITDKGFFKGLEEGSKGTWGFL